MGSFDVKFGLDANYFDPEYRSLYVKVIGQASVSSEERDGSESDQEIVRGLIGIGINNALSDLSSKNAPVKTLVDHKNEFTQFITESLKERNITLSSLNLMSVNPDAQSRERIEKIEKMKAMSSKSPEELEKMRQEAARKAQEYLDSLTPEQRLPLSFALTAVLRQGPVSSAVTAEIRYKGNIKPVRSNLTGLLFSK